MLKISTKKPVSPLRLDLGGDAALLLRKADALDVIAAEGEAVRIAAAIESGAEAASTYFVDMPADAVLSEQRRIGMVDFLTEVELAMQIVSGLENIEMDGAPQTSGSRVLFSALFRETGIFNAFRRLARLGLHERTLLGNGSGNSPTGGPPAAPPIVDPAAISGSRALGGSAATTGASVQNESMAS
jgi:hypothetical protein